MLDQPPPGLSVLIVDDDPDCLALTGHLVAKCAPAAAIHTAHAGREGLDFLAAALQRGGATALPDLVLLDLNMPEMDGFAVLRAVRGDPALSTLKIVMLSSSDDPADIKTALDLGARGYLIKHPSPSCLTSLLKEIQRTTAAPF